MQEGKESDGAGLLGFSGAKESKRTKSERGKHDLSEGRDSFISVTRNVRKSERKKNPVGMCERTTKQRLWER